MCSISNCYLKLSRFLAKDLRCKHRGTRLVTVQRLIFICGLILDLLFAYVN